MTAEDISVATTVDDLFALPEEEDAQPAVVPAPVEYVSQENTGDPVDWDKFDAEIAPPKTDGKVKPFKTVKERAAEARGEAPKTKGKAKASGAQAKQSTQRDLGQRPLKDAPEKPVKVKAEKAPKPVKVKAEKAPSAPKAQTAKPPKVVAIPATLDKMPKDVQAAFQADYPAALAEGVRRGKSDRGDFAAGYLMAYRRFSLRSASGSDAASKGG